MQLECYEDNLGRKCLTSDRDRDMVRRIRWRGLVQAIHRAPPRSPEHLRGVGTPYDPAGVHAGITRALHWTTSRSIRVGDALWRGGR